MTRPDLDALAALLERATPGPWYECSGLVTPSHRLFTETRHENAALIVAAVNALPALLTYVRELERDNTDLRHDIGRAQAANAELATAERTAALAMRERCAQACEELSLRYDGQESEASSRVYADLCRGSRNGADACAAAIRALET